MRRVQLLQILIVVIVVMLIGVVIKQNIITYNLLVCNNTLITTIKDIITILAIIAGAILSYFRFFAGRTFSAKADIQFDVSLIETPQKKIMHVVSVSILNLGSLTIWNPVAKIGIKQFNDTKQNQDLIVEKFHSESYFKDKGRSEPVIDVGEKGYYMIWHEFDTSTWAVTYTVELTSSGGQKWQSSKTVANKIEMK